MKYFIALFMVLVVAFVVVDSAQAATKECHNFGGSDDFHFAATNSRLYQTFTAGASPLTEVSINAYRWSDLVSGNLSIVIVELVGGEPSGVAVADTQASSAAIDLPLIDLGDPASQAFDCNNIPDAQTFTFCCGDVDNLVPGTDYAISFHATTFAEIAFPYYSGEPGEVAEPSVPWKCSGLGICTSWAIWEHPPASGFNPDVAFQLENLFADGEGGSDTTINDHLGTFRNYISLEDNQGGLLLTLLAMTMLYVIAFFYKINFLVITALNAVLFGLFASEDIVEGWILITAVAVGGMAVVFKLTTGRGSSDES